MAYNFKSIADVEVVEKPTDAANVLIEENGVIKKAPKSAVGGGGNIGQYHIAVRYDEDSGEYISDFTYNDIYALMEAGAFLYATVEVHNGDSHYKTDTGRGYFYCSNYAMPNSDVIYFTNLSGNHSIVFYDNNGIDV